MNKKIISMALAFLMVLALAVPAVASGVPQGSITINNNGSAMVKDRTFKAYKILDATYDGVGLAPDGTAYQVPDSMKGFYEDYDFDGNPLTVDLDFTDMTPGQINEAVTNAINSLDRVAFDAFARAAWDAADNATGVYSVEFTGDDSGASVDVPYGYYVIKDISSPVPANGRLSAVMVDTNTPDVEIALKADVPEIDKGIVDPDKEEPVKSTDAAIGDPVTYRLTTRVPDMTGFSHFYFVITDTLSKGLTFNGVSTAPGVPSGVTVKLGGQALVEGMGTNTEVPDAYHVVVTNNDDDTTTIEIIFHNFIQYHEAEDRDIVVEYSATINEYALIGNAGNSNTATLTYSNDPSHHDDKDKPGDTDPKGTTPETKTKVFVTEIELTKKDDNGGTLTGAKFKLEGDTLNHVIVDGEVFTKLEEGEVITAPATGPYWLLKNGTYTLTDPATDGINTDAYGSTTDKYKMETVQTIDSQAASTVVEGWVGADGKLSFTGLPSGTYTLTELIAPDGYNLLLEPITIVIKADLPTVITSDPVVVWSVDAASVEATVTDDGIITFNVENNTGTILPGTGGIGTTLFTVGGLLLMGGAALFLILRRRAASAK